MDLHPLDPLGLAEPDPVGAGWARATVRGPRTVSEVLRAASEAMDEEDRQLELARDPLAYVRLPRPRRLVDVILNRRARR